MPTLRCEPVGPRGWQAVLFLGSCCGFGGVASWRWSHAADGRAAGAAGWPGGLQPQASRPLLWSQLRAPAGPAAHCLPALSALLAASSTTASAAPPAAAPTCTR